MKTSDLRPETLCIQAGYTPGNGEPRQIPIIQSTTFRYETSEAMGKLFDLEADGYFYSRLQNPTCDHVAAKIAALEGGTAAMLTGSGQAANFMAMFNIAGCGDHIVSSASIYGGSYNLFAVTMKRMGLSCTFVDPDCSAEELNAAFRPNTKAVFGETIANPALTVLDIEKFAAAAHAHGVPLIVDNTFATPVNCRPLSWGADIVTHSTTKYMDGHAAALGGCIVDGGKFDWTKYPEKFPGLRIGKHIAVDALENIGVPVVRLDLIGAVDVAVAVFLAGDRSAADGEVGNGWLHAVCSLQSSIILSFFPCYAAVQADGNPHCGLVFLVMRRNPCFWQDFRRAVQEQVVTSTAFPLLYQDFTIIASKYPIFDGPSKKVHILSGIFWAFAGVIPRC